MSDVDLNRPGKLPTFNPATLLSIRVINDVITSNLDHHPNRAIELAETLVEPAEWHGGSIQTVETRLQGSPWYSVEVMDEHTSSLSFNDRKPYEGTYAESLIRLVKAIFGTSVAGDIAPFLLDPSLISDGWN